MSSSERRRVLPPRRRRGGSAGTASRAPPSAAAVGGIAPGRGEQRHVVVRLRIRDADADHDRGEEGRIGQGDTLAAEIRLEVEGELVTARPEGTTRKQR